MAPLSRLACAAIAALALLSTASAGVNTPQSGWYSGNPLLGPSTLTELACSKATCYASGQFGTLLKSTNSGSTWSGIITGLTLDLTRVRLAGGSSQKVLVGGGCAVRRSDDGGETFFRLPFTARDASCPTPIASFSFPTDKIGYLLLTDGKVLATADGGRTFSRRTALPGASAGVVANDIVCTAARTCFAVGESGLIERTTDGGVAWRQAANARVPLRGLEATTKQVLYAVGANLMVVRSTDGGKTWTRQDAHDVPPANLSSIRCADAFRCLIATQAGTQVLRTFDGGESYASIVPSTDATYAVAFMPPARAIAAGALGSAELSGDAGDTWRAVGSRVAGSFTTLAALSDTVAYAGGQNGVLARTVDGGQTWSNSSPPTDSTIVGLTGAAPDRLYVLAADGTLQRSDNGGSSYRLLNPGTSRPDTIAALDADRLLLFGPRGVVRSADGGETFDPVLDRVARGALVNDVDVAPGAVVAFSQLTAIVSTDRGLHWRRIVRPRRRAILDLDFATPRIGYLLDTRGGLWRTANGGRSWSERSSLGTNAAYGIEFADARNGYAPVRSFGGLRGFGLVLRTADGGASWHPQLVSRSVIASVRTGGATDYALAGDSFLYATATRGDTGGGERLTLSTRSRSIRHPGRITVSGRLSPADGGEEIVVARRAGGRWTVQGTTAASNGTFQTRWRVGQTSFFVAQVLGDADHVGAGTPPLRVRVGR